MTSIQNQTPSILATFPVHENFTLDLGKDAFKLDSEDVLRDLVNKDLRKRGLQLDTLTIDPEAVERKFSKAEVSASKSHKLNSAIARVEVTATDGTRHEYLIENAALKNGLKGFVALGVLSWQAVGGSIAIFVPVAGPLIAIGSGAKATLAGAAGLLKSDQGESSKEFARSALTYGALSVLHGTALLMCDLVPPMAGLRALANSAGILGTGIQAILGTALALKDYEQVNVEYMGERLNEAFAALETSDQ